MRLLSIVVAITLFGASFAVLAAVVVKEVPSNIKASEDAAIKGGRFNPLELKKAPPEFEHKGANDTMEKTQWLPVTEVELKQGESHEETVSFTKSTLVLARVTWLGSSSPVKLIVTKDTVTLATGKPHPVPPNRGTVTARAEITTAGSASILTTNEGVKPVRVQIVVGTLPLSF